MTWLPTTALMPSLMHSCLTSSAIEVKGTTNTVVEPEVKLGLTHSRLIHPAFITWWPWYNQVMKWSFKFPYFVDGFTRRQEKGGYQGTHSLAIACGHAAQDVVALSAINGRSHYVSLKLNILQGFSSQDTGESGCMIPENRAAVQAAMGAFASAGCTLAQTSPSSPLSQLSFHCQLHPPSEKLSNEMRWEQKLSPTSLPHPAAATSNVLEIPSTDQGVKTEIYIHTKDVTF